MKLNAPNIIRTILRGCPGQYLAVHEITALARGRGYYISDNATASRLCMELKSETENRFRRGVRYKEWRILYAKMSEKNQY